MKKRLIHTLMFPLYFFGLFIGYVTSPIIGIFIYIIKGVNPMDYSDSVVEYFIRKMEGR